MSYEILMSSLTEEKIKRYQERSGSGTSIGNRLRAGLEGVRADEIEFEEFLESTVFLIVDEIQQADD